MNPARTIGRVRGRGGIGYIVAAIIGVRLKADTTPWDLSYAGDTMKKHIALLGAFAVVAVVALTAQQPAAVKAFTGMRLVDGTDRAPIDNATILVRDGRVAAAGPAASVTIPADAERVSLAGKHVIPGLINAHGHANSLERDLDTYAKYGVTTVFSLGNDAQRAGGDRRP